ncbi:MAG: metallophosphatase, partial [Alphaproteobacteria bacterium]|nr:metallophosphatase [Alphaproteobacteria bacterium]
HLHPAARVRINGRTTRRPCFVADEKLMVLPAYGAATGSLDLAHKAFDGLFDRSRLQVCMLGRDRVYPVAIRHLQLG